MVRIARISLRFVIALLGAAVPLTGSTGHAAGPAGASAADPGTVRPEPVAVTDTFVAADVPATARTYDSELVPEGATARVRAVVTPLGGTTTRLVVRGLRPHRAYGAHAHVHPCGLTGDHAGPHFQHIVDPVQPRPTRDTRTRQTRFGSTSPPTLTATASRFPPCRGSSTTAARRRW